jgi:hypothetical protein
MRWQTIRNAIAVIAVGLLVSWGIASLTYGSTRPANLTFRETPIAEPEPLLSPTQTPSDIEEQEDTGGQDEPLDQVLITDSITVQLLDGSGDEGAAERMSRRLRGLGLDVAFTDVAAETGQSTVFWSSEESKKAAKTLARYLKWPARAKPISIVAPADIHVLVGTEQ